jgi:quercetin dioxygenase-like cupin family protein
MEDTSSNHLPKKGPMISGFKRYRSLSAMVLAAIVGLVAGWNLRIATGEIVPPTADHGITRERGPDVDLGPDLAGYRLRMTVVTFEPGAVRAIHDHKQNPEAAYIVQGTLTESRKGSGTQDFNAGAMRSNGREVEHWLENRSSAKAVQVVATVVKAP